MFETAQGIIKPIAYVGIIHGDKLLLVDYQTAPNPDKKGWWIPAPGLEFGQEPEKRAQQVFDEFGLSAGELQLKGVESFVLPGGWHLIYHYIAVVSQANAKPNANVKAYKWVSQSELPKPEEFAHGGWEQRLAKDYLEFAGKRAGVLAAAGR